MPKYLNQAQRFLPFAVLLLTVTGCNFGIDMVYCENPIGTPWPNEKLKTLEGDWVESTDTKKNGYQRVVYRFIVDSEKNGITHQEIDDPRMPRSLDKSAPLIRLTSLDSVDLVFLKGPDDHEYTILLGVLERPDEDTLSIRLADPKAFREQIKKGMINGEILPPYLDDTQAYEPAIRKTTVKVTEDQLEKLIRDESDKPLFEPTEGFLKRIKR